MTQGTLATENWKLILRLTRDWKSISSWRKVNVQYNFKRALKQIKWLPCIALNSQKLKTYKWVDKLICLSLKGISFSWIVTFLPGCTEFWIIRAFY